jgi:hypothetical protein
LASCKRFKLKREQEREIAELDLNNIIDYKDNRITRNRTRNSGLTSNINSKKPKYKVPLDDEESEEADNTDSDSADESPVKNDFSSIKDLIQSESSEEETTDKKKKNQVINSNDEDD